MKGGRYKQIMMEKDKSEMLTQTDSKLVYSDGNLTLNGFNTKKATTTPHPNKCCQILIVKHIDQ